MTTLGWTLVIFSLLALGMHALSAALAAWQLGRSKGSGKSAAPAPSPIGTPRVSIVRPVCGIDDIERETLATTFTLESDAEILFCASRPDDPAVAYLRAMIAAHPNVDARILTGDDLATANPKLNNVAKGWRAATGDFVVMVDSNVVLPRDYVARLLEMWDRPATGLVSAPPIGGRPQTFWAEVECGFLNTYQARWQYAVDALGLGFAQGKTLMFRKADLERWGGIEALTEDLAEDAASTKLVRKAGLTVRLVSGSFEQPLGERSRAQIWSRQVRWAQLRRMAFPHLFLPEILTGMWIPLAAILLGALMLDLPETLIALSFAGLWIGIEAALAVSAGWHLGWRSPLAWMVRDALIPVLWLQGLFGRGYEWRGNRVVTETEGPAMQPSPASAGS